MRNGLFATWFNAETGDGDPYANCVSNHGDALCTFPICTESGICPFCRFGLVVGAITDLQVRLSDLQWGDPEESIPSSPDQVDEDNISKYELE